MTSWMRFLHCWLSLASRTYFISQGLPITGYLRLISFLLTAHLLGASFSTLASSQPLADTASAIDTSVSNESTLDASIPPYLSPYRGKASILLSLDSSVQLNLPSYDQAFFQPIKGDGRVGMFEPERWYRYDERELYFVAEDASSKLTGSTMKARWQGQFLNWLCLRRIDQLKWLLLGTELNKSKFDQQRNVVSFAQNATRQVSAMNSLQYSPIKNYQEISLKNGFIEVQDRRYRMALKKAHRYPGLLALGSNQYRFHMLSQSGRLESSLERVKASIRRWQPRQELHNSFAHEQSILGLVSFIKSKRSRTLFYDDVSREVLPCQPLLVLNLASSQELSGRNRHSISQLKRHDCQAMIPGKQLAHWVNVAADLSAESELSMNGQWLPLTKSTAVSQKLAERLQRESDRGLINRQFSGASALSSSIQGMSILYQSYFRPQSRRYKGDKAPQHLTWRGDLVALMLDSEGLVRSDNGDRKLSSAKEDPYLDTCFDKNLNVQRYRLSHNKNNRPSVAEQSSCSSLAYPSNQEDLGYLWSAERRLSDLRSLSAGLQRAEYRDKGPLRYILSSQAGKEFDFVASAINEDNYAMLGVSSLQEARRLVEYVRGVDHQTSPPPKGRSLTDIKRAGNSRGESPNRQLLGDFIHSRPAIVSSPRGNFDLLYGDSSYTDFRDQYKARREVIYVGGNDGMLHAFNGGWRTKNALHSARQSRQEAGTGNGSDAISAASSVGNSETYRRWDLGQEIWAFVPEASLSRLKYLKEAGYGLSVSDHRYFIDASPYVFDARIFTKNGIKGQQDRLFTQQDEGYSSRVTHPNGWGTILVVGAGGFQVAGGKEQGAPSAFLIFDITDAEQAPKLLAEFKHADLGDSSAQPSAFTISPDFRDSEKTSSASNLDWFLAFGSGQGARTAQLFIFDLQKMSLSKSFGREGVLTLGWREGRAYVGGISAVDYHLDAQTDSLYVGTVREAALESDKAATKGLGGELYRLDLNGAGHHKVRVHERLKARGPIISRPVISADSAGNHWVHFSTGRLEKVSDYLSLSQATIASSYIYGFKDRPGERLSDKALRHGQLLKRGNEEHILPEHSPLDDETYIGWYRALPLGESSLSETRVLGGVLTQASYVLDSFTCRFSGRNKLHQYHALSGKELLGDELSSSKLGSSHASGLSGRPAKELRSIESFPEGSLVLHILKTQNSTDLVPMLLNSDGRYRSRPLSMGGTFNSRQLSWREL